MPSNTHADTSWLAKLPLEGADGCPLCMSNHTLRYGLGGPILRNPAQPQPRTVWDVLSHVLPTSRSLS